MRGFGVYGDGGFVPGEGVGGWWWGVCSVGFGVGAVDAEDVGAIVGA